jgi:hypothetical protein
MKTKILYGSISRFIPQFFYGPDAGGGSGGDGGAAGAGGDGGAAAGGAAGDAGAAGGDGGAAGGDGSADFDGFKPPALGDVDFSKTDPAPPVPKVDPKPTDPPPTDPKKGKGTPQPKAPDGSPAALRAELDALKKEKSEWEAKSKIDDPRIAAAIAERDKFKTDHEAATKQIADYEKRLLLADPAVRQKLEAFDLEYQKKAGRFYTSVPSMDQNRVHALAQEYAKLPFNKPEFAKALEDFEGKVNLALGGTDEKEHRSLERTLDWIRDNVDSSSERAKLSKEVTENAEKIARDSQVQGYQATKKGVDDLLKAAFEVPENLTDATHPRVALKNFDTALTPEQIAAIDKDIPEFVRLVFAGTPPRTDADFAGMQPEQIREIRQREAANELKARHHAVDIMANGLRALRRFPTLMKELARLRDRVKETAAGDPGADGGGEGGGAAGGAAGDDNLTNFVPRDLAGQKF